MAEQPVQVTLEIVGPMKRSTLAREQQDPIDRAVNDILHWSWSTRLQAQRLTASLGAEFAAWNWRPQVRARRSFSASSYDEHLVFVAAANLSRALDSAPKGLRALTRIADIPARALRLLRDVYEHWDQLRRQVAGDATSISGAAHRLAVEFPCAEPWSLTFDPRTGQVILANVVDLNQLISELRLLEARLLRWERKHRAQTGNAIASTG